jgi:hypothetical protein
LGPVPQACVAQDASPGTCPVAGAALPGAADEAPPPGAGPVVAAAVAVAVGIPEALGAVAALPDSEPELAHPATKAAAAASARTIAKRRMAVPIPMSW